MKKFYLTSFSLFIGTAFAQSPLLVENFDYPEGDALTTHSWEAHSAPDNNPVLVTTPGLSFEGYVNSDIGNAAGINNTGQDVNKSFNVQENTAVYTSFLLQVNATGEEGGYFVHLGASPITTAHRARTFVLPTEDETKFNFGLSFNASSAQEVSEVEFTYGETYLLVVKYNSIEGADNDEVSLYVFSTTDNFSVEPETPLIGPLAGTQSDINPGTIALRQYSADQLITIDGIQISTVWDIEDDSANVSDNFKSSIKIYPNPVNNGLLIIEDPNSFEDKVEIYDLSGKQLLDISGLEAIDVSGFQSGIYIVKKGNQEETLLQKIIINN